MIIIEMAKIESTGGQIEIMLVIEITKIKFNRQPYWIYFIYIDYQNEIRMMLIIEMAKIELDYRRWPYWIDLFI